MKRIATLLCITLAVVSYGQSKEVYALVKVFSKQNSKRTAYVDFGDGTPRMAIANDNNKVRNFESDFEPINLLIKEGWEIEKFSSFWDAYNTVTIWVMKKKVENDSQIKEGLKLTKE